MLVSMNLSLLLIDNTIDSFVSVDYVDQNYSILLFDIPTESNHRNNNNPSFHYYK